MKTSQATLNQLKTYRIFKSLPKYDLVHIAEQSGLLLTYYDSHVKRAAGMVVVVHEEGTTAEMEKILNKAFE